jgi:hypothetical protein
MINVTRFGGLALAASLVAGGIGCSADVSDGENAGDSEEELASGPYLSFANPPSEGPKATNQGVSVYAVGLPAVSQNGDLVAYLDREDYGLSDMSTYDFEARRVADDGVFLHKPLIDIVKGHGDVVGTGAEGNLPAVRKFLDARKWVHITMHEAGGDNEVLISAARWGIVYAKGNATVRPALLVRDNAKPFTDRLILNVDATSYNKPPRRLAPGLSPCVFQPYLRSAAIAPVRKAVVVRIGYHFSSGPDACTMQDEFHTYRLP